MMSLYKDGCMYGDRILLGGLLHGSFACMMGRRLRNKQSECVVNLSGSKHQWLLLHCHNKNGHGISKLGSRELYFLYCNH